MMRRPLAAETGRARSVLRAGCATLAFAALIGAVVPSAQSSVPRQAVAPGMLALGSTDYSVALPAGWALIRGYRSTRVWITRDGAAVSLITVSFLRRADVPVPLRRRYRDAGGPQEFAEAMVEIAAREDGAGPLEVELLSSSPATLGGTPGFRLDVRRRTPSATFRRVVYGWAAREGVYLLQLDSPEIHYLQRDLPDLEAMARSVARRGARSP